jgi:hypothetical protein
MKPPKPPIDPIPLADFLARVPEFLANEGLQPGEYMRTAKDAIRIFERPNQDLPVRLAALALLQSHGYERNVAVILRKGKLDFLRPHDAIRMLDQMAVRTFKESGQPLSDERREQLKPTRQNIRRAFAALEDGFGQVVRCRPKVSVEEIGKLSLPECIEKGFVTPLDQLSGAELKRVGGNVCTFFLPKGRPAKNLSNVVTSDYVGSSKVLKPNGHDPASAAQLFLAWGNEFGVDPELLKKHPELHKEMDKYVLMEQKVHRDEIARKRQELKMRSMAELIAREAGKPTTAGTQEPLFPAEQPVTSSAPLQTSPLHPSEVSDHRGADSLSAAVNSNGGSHPPLGGNDISPTVDATAVEHTIFCRGVEHAATAEPPLVSQPRKKGAPRYSPEAYQLLDVLIPHVAADLEGSQTIITRCRENAPNSTISQICAWGEQVARDAKKGGKGFGWVIWGLPKKFQGASQGIDRRQPTREEELAYLRREWHSMKESERQEYLAAFPELAMAQAASGD